MEEQTNLNQDYRDLIKENARPMLQMALDMLEGRCQGAELLFDFGKTLSVSSEKEQISKYLVSSTSIIGVRLIKEGRLGISYSESLDEHSIKQMVDDAISNSRFSEAKEHERIVVQRGTLIEDNQFTVSKVKDPSVEQVMSDAIRLESAVLKKDPRVKVVPFNGVYHVEGGRMIVNSLGTALEKEFKYFGCYTSALISEQCKNSDHNIGLVARDYQRLDFDHCIDVAYQEALNQLKGKLIPTKKYDVIFSIECLHQIFSCFSLMFSAQGAMEGHNPFRGKVGECHFSPLLSITDNPLYEGGLSYSTFDSEGEKGQELVLVKKGILNNFYHNWKTANHFMTQSTGHASRSPKSSLNVGSTNLFIEAGLSDKGGLFSGTTLFITKLQGLHSGAHPVSGDFSFGAKGYLMLNGEVQQAVSGITVSGNFYQMLKNIDSIGKEVEEDDLTFFSPKIRFRELNIAGSNE